MLIEALLYATAASTPALRRLGLVGDSVALWSRATRWRRRWTPHADRCRILVEAACAGLERHDTVLVLGSGLMREIPLRLLTSRFRRVILADAVHLLPLRRRLRGRSVELALVDLTGVAAALTGGGPERVDPLGRFRADPRIDLVVSANCLSQLPMAPSRRLEKRPHLAARVRDAATAAVLANHLADLAGFACPVCLLADVEFRDVARDGTVGASVALLPGLDLPCPEAAWDWEVAPFGEISRRFARLHRVQGWRDIRAHLRADDGARGTGGATAAAGGATGGR